MFSLNRQVVVLAILLSITGLFYIFHKHYALGLPLNVVQNDPAWTVGMEVSFTAKYNKPIKLSVAVPQQSPNFSKLRETLLVGDYGANYSIEGDNRIVTFTKRRARGLQKLYYQSTLVQVEETEVPATKTKKQKLPQKPELNKLQQLAAEQLIEDVRATSADIASFTIRLLEVINEGAKNSNISMFLGKNRDAESKARVARDLLAIANISSRIVYGVLLQEGVSNAALIVRLEVHDEEQWLSFDPLTTSMQVPKNFLIWCRNTSPMIAASGVSNPQFSISISQTLVDPIETALRRADKSNWVLASFSLTSLPVVTQNTLKILLMIPVGALVIILLRTVIGLKTFGTFAPVLIAIAFIQTRLGIGLALFIGIVSIALMVRFYFERLKLLLVPRLAAVVTIIVIILIVLNVVFSGLGITFGLSSSLLPIVILAMVVERMSLSWEEVGAWETIQQGTGTLVAAVIGYLVITLETIQFFVFIYPESLLVILAFMIVMGRYTGYRLSELTRFKDLG